MDVLEHLRVNWLAFGFDIRDLAANHSINRAGGSSNFHDDGGAALGGGGRCTNRFECQGQESIACENSDSLAEFLVASRLSAAEVILVQCRQIVVDTGICVKEFY